MPPEASAPWGSGEPPAIFLMGPTAAGKTELALALARQLPVELVSVDSAMVYRGLDIGTAKPPPATREQIPHYLIDICEPTESYSAGRFRRDATAALAAIRAQGRAPLLAGGTGLYFRALEQGFSPLPPTKPAVRERLEARLRTQGLAALRAELERVDPASARRIHPNDSQRTQRALEVYETANAPLSELFARGRLNPLSQRVIKLALAPSDRRVARERIRRRFLAMLEAGLVEETRRFFEREDMHAGLPSMRLVGYRQAWRHLEGRIDAATMREQAVVATQQLAKRQLTWLRGERDAVWFDSLDPGHPQAVLAFLQARLKAPVDSVAGLG